MKIAMISMQTAAIAAVERPGVDELAAEMTRQGHAVTIYTRREAGRAPARLPGTLPAALPEAEVVRLPVGPRRRLKAGEEQGLVAEFGRALADRWLTDRPDVAHAYGWTSGLAALTAQREALVIPVVQTYLNPAGDPARIRLERALGRTVGAVVAGSVREQDTLVDIGLPRPRVAVIPPGVDTATFSDHGPAYPRGGRPRLLMTCGPDLAGGVDVALRMLSGVPDAELVVAGGAGDADRRAGAVRSLARRLGVADRLILLGEVDRANAPQLLRSADLVLSLGGAESYGLVVLEAMACGVPVVADRSGSHLDMVIDGVTGLLADPTRPVELAHRVRALIADRTRLTALGIAAADRARSRHGWDRIAAETVAVYERVS